MQTQNRILDDLTSLLTSVGSAASQIKEEADGAVRARLERIAADLDLVSREEFEVVKELAAKAMAKVEALEKELEALKPQN